MSTPLSSASLVQLLCFVRVVEAGSFAEAGRRTGMTTSGVSKAIARFEKTHGLRLLHRSTHALSVTAEGEQLLIEAREALRGVERLEDVLAQAADGGRAGRVRISAPTAFVRACLAPVLPRLLAKHPEIRVDIRSSDSMTDLADEGVDLALRTGRIDGIPGHVSQTLMTFPWTACATPAYLAGREMPSSPADLADHELIGFRNSGTGRLEAWRFRSTVRGSEDATARHEPDARMIFDDALTAWDMARNSHGIAWAPAWLALDDLRRGRVVEVLKEWRCGEMPLSMVRRERRLTPKRTKTVIAFLADVANEWRL